MCLNIEGRGIALVAGIRRSRANEVLSIYSKAHYERKIAGVSTHYWIDLRLRTDYNSDHLCHELESVDGGIASSSREQLQETKGVAVLVTRNNFTVTIEHRHLKFYRDKATP